MARMAVNVSGSLDWATGEQLAQLADEANDAADLRGPVGQAANASDLLRAS